MNQLGPIVIFRFSYSRGEKQNCGACVQPGTLDGEKYFLHQVMKLHNLFGIQFFIVLVELKNNI